MTSNSQISFLSDGSPFSQQFDDIYFDTESGCLQSEQVFIQGNNIAEKLTANHGTVTIAETGFGTGLNFLLTLALYHKLTEKHPLAPVHFITTEKYPLTLQQLKQSLTCLPQLKQFSEMLIAQYPKQLSENIELNFYQGQVKLTILLGDATQAFLNLTSPKLGLVDAWYLDGFSPSKNPDMWQPALFEQIGRLSKEQASVATFTVAGIVRRGLTNNGFRLQRKSYGGKKKEILVGKYQQGKLFGKSYTLRPINNKPQHVSIIGGGIAAACAAYQLVQQGIKVTLLCKDKAIAQGASSNNIGALYPLIHQKKDDISLYFSKAFEKSLSFYQHIIQQGFSFPHQWCGLLELSHNENLLKRQQGFEQSKHWPTDLIKSIDKHTASEHANINLEHGGLFYPKAGWVAPQKLVEQIFNAASQSGLLKIKCNITVSDIESIANNKWQLITNKGKLNASILVVAGGAESINLPLINKIPMKPVRGQVTTMRTNKDIEPLSTVICHKGYLTPANDKLHCIGATFDKDDTDTASREEDDCYNLAVLKSSMGTDFNWQKSDISSSKARLRCTTPDHLPIVGPVAKVEQHPDLYAHLAKDKNWRYQTPPPYYPNLFLLSGLGARGLCSAPLLAEVLVADICGTPYPIDNQMLFNLSTNRFIIRDIIKRKV